MIDVIIVSDAKTDRLRKITQQAVDTANLDNWVNCIVVEGNHRAPYYKNAITIYLDQAEFNYNYALNAGAEHGGGQYIAFCNNDVIFKPGWSGIVEEMLLEGYDSASPWCDYSHPPIHGARDKRRGIIRGRHVRTNFAGWCFIWKRELYSRIGPLPETYRFFCADNAVVKLMEKYAVAHFLSRLFVVNHLGSMTLKEIPKDERGPLTLDPVRDWNRDHNTNLFDWGKND